MARILVTGCIVALAAGLWACGDDAEPPGGDSGGKLDGASGDGGTAGLTLKSLSPEKSTLIVNMLQDVYVELSGPAKQPVYVDVTSKDPASVAVVHAQLKFDTYDTKEMTTIQGLKLTSGKEIAIEFKLRGSTSTKTHYAKVQQKLPDAGVVSDL